MASAESTGPSGGDDEGVRGHGRTNRARGFKSIQLWVPDVESETFSREAHRQAVAVATSPYAADDEAFIDSISDFFDE